MDQFTQHKEDQYYEKMYAQQTRYQREIARHYPKKSSDNVSPAEEVQDDLGPVDQSGEVRGYIRSLKAQQSGYSKNLSAIGRTPQYLPNIQDLHNGFKTSTNFNSPHRNSKLFIEGTATGSNQSLEISPEQLTAKIEVKTVKNVEVKKKKKLKLEDMVYDKKYHEFRNTQGSTQFRQSFNGSKGFSDMRTHLDVNFQTLSPAQFAQSMNFNQQIPKNQSRREQDYFARNIGSSNEQNNVRNDVKVTFENFSSKKRTIKLSPKRSRF